jgi:HK97 family phage major capsid protein
MGTMLELANELYERRRRAVATLQEHHAAVEAGDANGEHQATADRINAEINDLGSRIDNLLTQVELEKQTSADRERFERLITPDPATGSGSESFAEKVRTWMRAALPDAEVWAPRSISVKFGTVGIDIRDRGWALPGMAPLEQHDLTKGTATAGAELIPTGFVRTLYQHLIEFAAVRQTNAQVFRTTSGENLLVPKTTSYGTAALVAEAGPLAEADPAFAQVTIGAYKYGQLVQISRELIEDSAVDILGFLAKSTGIALGVANGAHLVTGTGSAQPQGIANAPVAGVTGATGTTTSVVGNSIIDLYHSVVSGYRRNGYWVMNDATLAAVRKIRDDTGGAGLGNFLWQPGMTAGAPDTLLGRPVITDPNMAVMAANAYSIAFGDFSLYFAIRDVDGVRFERSDDYAFANDLVTFRALIRTDSRQLVNGASGAVKFYRNSAT